MAPSYPTVRCQESSSHYIFIRVDSENVLPSAADSSKLVEYDEHYLKELTEEKESLSKTGRDTSHALRLLEAGQSHFYKRKFQ